MYFLYTRSIDILILIDIHSYNVVKIEEKSMQMLLL